MRTFILSIRVSFVLSVLIDNIGMFTVEMLINAYARNLHFIKTHTKGFTQADALRQPQPSGNCANWIVGHIAAYRSKVLEHLALDPVFDTAQAARYQANTPPVLGEEPGIAILDDLLEAIELAQTRIEHGLQHFTPIRAAEMTQIGPWNMTRAEAVLFLMRHESYHTGQLEFLSELARA